MKRSSRNVIIGLVLGLVVAGAALTTLYYYSRRLQTDDRLEKARIPLEQATALEEEAKGLAGAGKSGEAEALRREAKSKYDEATRLFSEIYRDTKADMSTRLTAAYHIGLIGYARGSEDERNNAVALLLVVIRDSTDTLERFEACRVVASWYWDRGDIASVRNVFQIVLDDKEMRARLEGLLYSVKNSGDGRTDLEFFIAHPELGLTPAAMNADPFSSNDETYWNRARFYHTIAQKITAGKSGLEAVARLFEWCCRNIVTLPEEIERDIPTPPYQRMLAAHGTSDERAWVFCTLVESLWKYRGEKGLYNYEVMIIQVGENTLVSVWDGEKACLYDMDMCLPVYGQDGATPVSLADVRGQDDFPLNTGLNGVSYPYKSGDIKNAYYFIPFNPRSAAFKQALVLPSSFIREPLLHRTTGDYRPLYESAVSKMESAVRGYFSRKVQKFEYPYNDPDGGVLQLWDVPFEEYQFARLESILRSAGEDAPEIKGLDDQKRERLDGYIRVSEATDNRLRPLLDGREFQFVGRFPDAAEWYRTQILAEPEKVGNAEAVEDASYYRCLALLDDAASAAEAEKAAALKDAEAALKQYLEAYAGGRWTDSVRFHLGMVYEQMGRNADAGSQFEQVKGSLEYPAKEKAAHIPSTAP